VSQRQIEPIESITRCLIPSMHHSPTRPRTDAETDTTDKNKGGRDTEASGIYKRSYRRRRCKWRPTRASHALEDLTHILPVRTPELLYSDSNVSADFEN